MSGPNRARETTEIVNRSTGTVVEQASMSTGSVLTAFVSLLALLMSGVSLYQTVLKQANLHLFVPDTISYTRDPNGSFEVVIVPVTIANSGARDGVISSLVLTVENSETGQKRELHATFFADQGYFSTKEDITKGLAKPKRAFAPLTVAGRSSYSGTVLFYPRSHSAARVIKKQGKFSFRLSATMRAVEKFDAVDQFFASAIKPVSFEATLPKVAPYFDGQMLSGGTARLFIENKTGDGHAARR